MTCSSRNRRHTRSPKSVRASGSALSATILNLLLALWPSRPVRKTKTKRSHRRSAIPTVLEWRPVAKLLGFLHHSLLYPMEGDLEVGGLTRDVCPLSSVIRYKRTVLVYGDDSCKEAAALASASL